MHGHHMFYLWFFDLKFCGIEQYIRPQKTLNHIQHCAMGCEFIGERHDDMRNDALLNIQSPR